MSHTSIGVGVGISVIVGVFTVAAFMADQTVEDAVAEPSSASVAAPVVDSAGIPQCDGYRSMADTYGYCLYKFAGGLPDEAAVERVCGMAGDWEDECRHAWVAGRMNPDSPFSTEALLRVCGENPDCAFELLDFRPADLVDDQLARCRDHAGRHASDCTGHAMQRWWLRGVDTDEVARVASMRTDFPRKVGFYLAVSVQCDEVGSCEGDPAVQDACERQVEAFSRKPESCPARVKAPLQPGKTKSPPSAVGSTGAPNAGWSGGGVPSTGGPKTPKPVPKQSQMDGQPRSKGGVGPSPAPAGKPGGADVKAGRGNQQHHRPGTIPAGLPPKK